MGNYHPTFTRDRQSPVAGKVILLDGSILEFDGTLTVAELMLEHPQQAVVEVNQSNFLTQKRLTFLPADRTLEVNKIYAMISLQGGNEANHLLHRVKAGLFSSEKITVTQLMVKEVNHLLHRAKAESFSSVSKSVLPLWAKIISTEDDGVANFEEIMERDWCVSLTRQMSSRTMWKPSLDTIVENRSEVRKESKWVVVVTKFGKRIQSKGLIWG